MLIGRIAKQEGPFWSADVEAIGAYTQGRSRKDAIEMLGALVKLMVARAGFEPTVTVIGAADDGATLVYVTANETSLLAALVLKYQREVHKLSLTDVARKLGASSRNAYARYEQGTAEPSLSKFAELLSAVAPDVRMTVLVPGVVSPRRRARKQ